MTSDGYDQTLVNHVGQCTTDVEATTRFYVELFGFEFERDLEIPDQAAGPLLGVEPPVNFSARYLRRGDFVLELLVYDRPDNPPRAERVMNEPGLTHLSFSVNELTEVLARVPELGGQVVFDAPFAAMVRDPDGQLLELLPMAYRQRLDADRAETPS